MYCLSVVDTKSLEESGRGLYIIKWKKGWKVNLYSRGEWKVRKCDYEYATGYLERRELRKLCKVAILIPIINLNNKKGY